MNVNEAPYPVELEALVERCSYRPGWTVELIDMDRGQKSAGLTLVIMTYTVNTYRPEEEVRVNHLFPVPPAAYDERSWQRWLFERFHDVELHETDLDQRTTFRGEVRGR